MAVRIHPVSRKSKLLAGVASLVCLNALAVQQGITAKTDTALPEWLLSAINAERKSALPGTFVEARYRGKRVFEFNRGDRFDTGDEHVLFSEDGKEICVFGGYAGHVTSGSCVIEMIVFVRKL
jgi:hypothetical protein